MRDRKKPIADHRRDFVETWRSIAANVGRHAASFARGGEVVDARHFAREAAHCTFTARPDLAR